MALAAGATGVSGCMGDRLDAGFGLQPTASYSFAGAADIALPDTMSVLPSSFAGPSPSGGSYVVASLPAADVGGEATVEQVAFPAAPDEPRKTRPLRGGGPSPELDALMVKYAELYDVPVGLVRSVARRESNFNPAAYNNGHWGLMQIKHATARGMGYKGPAKGLLDAETNLKYSVKYLRGAYLVAQGNQSRADRLYQRGYYYDAKRMGLLDETGLGRDRKPGRGA